MLDTCTDGFASSRTGRFCFVPDHRVVVARAFLLMSLYSFAGDEIEVAHFQFTAFPEHSTPVSPNELLALRAEVHAIAESNLDGPVLVHCNNGAGRTGVFICLDAELERYRQTGEPNLFGAVVAARRQRPSLVETKSQYVFLHRAFVTQLLVGANEVLEPQEVPDASVFLEKFVVKPGRMFDIGTPGRKILALNLSVTLHEASVSTIESAVVVTSDVVVLALSQKNRFIFQDYCPRDQVSAKALSTDTEELRLQVFFRKTKYVLGMTDVAAKTRWLDLLNNHRDYVPTPSLSGNRMIARRPRGRDEALKIMGSSDPQTFDGASTLKAEFATIPVAFNSGRSPVKTEPRRTTNPLYAASGSPSLYGLGTVGDSGMRVERPPTLDYNTAITPSVSLNVGYSGTLRPFDPTGSEESLHPSRVQPPMFPSIAPTQLQTHQGFTQPATEANEYLDVSSSQATPGVEVLVSSSSAARPLSVQETHALLAIAEDQSVRTGLRHDGS